MQQETVTNDGNGKGSIELLVFKDQHHRFNDLEGLHSSAHEDEHDA